MNRARPISKRERTPEVFGQLHNLAAAAGRTGLTLHEFLALDIPPTEQHGRVWLWDEKAIADRAPYGLVVSLEIVLAPQGTHPLGAHVAQRPDDGDGDRPDRRADEIAHGHHRDDDLVVLELRPVDRRAGVDGD